MNLIVSILVITGLLFGGGATVNAAQNDLPNEPLYGLKLWGEDLSLQFQNEPQQRVERLMDLAQVRIREMTRLSDTNQVIPDVIRQQLQDHIQQALQICAALDDPELNRNLLQVRDRMQQQDRDMEQLQLHATQNEQGILLQTRTMIQQRLRLVDEGLLNHEMFRNTVRSGFRFGQESTATPPIQKGNGLQNGQPTLVPAGPSTNPGGPNIAPTASNNGPGGPNMNQGGANINATPSSTTGGGMGGNGSGNNGSGVSGTGGNGKGGKGSGGNGSGSTDAGRNGTGGGGGRP